MQNNRRLEILSFVREKGTASLDELCLKFQVSKNTIRRDIQILADDEQLKKVYGGVTTIQNDLIPFSNRSIKNISEKERIGKIAAQYIQDGDMIYIDSGTTTKMILPFLDTHVAITLLTNSLDVINEATNFPNTQVILIGNSFKQTTRSFVSTSGYDVLKEYNINKAFMAATGVSITNGLTNSDFLEFEIKKNVCEKANQIFLLADHSKFDHVALMTFAPLERIDYIITDTPLSSNYETFCIENQIQTDMIYM